MSRTEIITTYLSLRLLVVSGFINIYPNQCQKRAHRFQTIFSLQCEFQYMIPD